MAFGGSGQSWMAGKVGSGLMLLGVSSAAVACSEGSTNPLPALEAGGGGNGGAAGAVAAGGSSAGSSGSTSTGGSAGDAPPTQVYDFTEGLEGFRISYYCLGPGMGAGCSPVDAAAAGGDSVTDGGGAVAPPSDATPIAGFVLATHDLAVGSPAPSAKVELALSADGQQAVFSVNFESTNLTGKVITAQVLMDAGGVPQTAGKLYVKTGPDFVYADSGQRTLTAGTWTTLTYSAPTYYANQAAYDITDVREIGIELAAPLATAFSTTVVHVDNVQY